MSNQREMYQHYYPCLHCHPHTYIRMVQNLIERCLLLHMDQDQCIKALAEHASIHPIVTLAVWRELLKENKDFFEAYFHSISPIPFSSQVDIRYRGLKEETYEIIKEKNKKN